MPDTLLTAIDTDALTQTHGLYVALHTPLAAALDAGPHLCVLPAALLHRLRTAPPQELAWFEEETHGWLLVVPDASPTWRRSRAHPVG